VVLLLQPSLQLLAAQEVELRRAAQLVVQAAEVQVEYQAQAAQELQVKETPAVRGLITHLQEQQAVAAVQELWAELPLVALQEMVAQGQRQALRVQALPMRVVAVVRVTQAIL
jgi:hypothetical protein